MVILFSEGMVITGHHATEAHALRPLSGIAPRFSRAA